MSKIPLKYKAGEFKFSILDKVELAEAERLQMTVSDVVSALKFKPG